MNADNLNTGMAFFFRTQKGNTAGRIEASGGANAKPFTTNATGVATGLNADQVDGQSDSDIQQARTLGRELPGRHGQHGRRLRASRARTRPAHVVRAAPRRCAARSTGGCRWSPS